MFLYCDKLAMQNSQSTIGVLKIHSVLSCSFLSFGCYSCLCLVCITCIKLSFAEGHIEKKQFTCILPFAKVYTYIFFFHCNYCWQLVYCSSKPTSGMSGPSHGEENFTRYNYGHRTAAAPCDWICTICGCMNFARRTSCFQVCFTLYCCKLFL
jgi:hypothetical protein